MIPFIMYLPSYHVGPDFTDTVLLETEKVLGTLQESKQYMMT